MSDEERAEMSGQADALWREITASGELISGTALADPVNTKSGNGTRRPPRHHRWTVHGGQGALAGYYVVDARALSAQPRSRPASRMPDSPPSRCGRSWTRPAGDVSAESEGVEDLLRELAPRVLGALVRRYGHFDACEDAVQEAMLAAAVQWPADGVPDKPRRLAGHRRVPPADRPDAQRGGRRRREETAAALTPPTRRSRRRRRAGARRRHADPALPLLPPALSPPSQVALTLRAVGGLTTAEIARAFLVPESTMAQRISRAKQRIKAAGARFGMPPRDERPDRQRLVLHVLYLIFNEGYTASSGPDLHRAELTAEAIRLTRGTPAASRRRRRWG